MKKPSGGAEFIELCAGKRLNQYAQADGVIFKDAQGLLPANRLRAPFKGLALTNILERAKAIAATGEQFPRLSTTTINDKINTASGFFARHSLPGAWNSPVAT